MNRLRGTEYRGKVSEVLPLAVGVAVGLWCMGRGAENLCGFFARDRS
jgi:hypothetical protein